MSQPPFLPKLLGKKTDRQPAVGTCKRTRSIAFRKVWGPDPNLDDGVPWTETLKWLRERHPEVSFSAESYYAIVGGSHEDDYTELWEVHDNDIRKLATCVWVEPWVWYHGSPEIIDKFDLSKLGARGLEQGPGIYLTDDENDAKNYGKVHKVHIAKTGKILRPELKTTPVKLIGRLVDALPEGKREIAYSNYDEHPLKARMKLIQTHARMDPHTSVCQLYADCFQRDAELFMRVMAKHGIDYCVLEKDLGVKHLVVYNTDVIRKIQAI